IIISGVSSIDIVKIGSRVSASRSVISVIIRRMISRSIPIMRLAFTSGSIIIVEV
ncbi:4660_t:CDS:1, partial [Cetraspora pellucida]